MLRTPWLVLSRIRFTCHLELWRLTLDPLWHNNYQNQKVKLKKRISNLFSIGRQFQVESAVNTTVFNVYSDSELCNVWGLSIIREYRSVPQIPPPFCNLSFSTNAGGGGLYAGCNNFSRDYTFLPIKHETLVVGWQASALRGESRALPLSSWCVHC